MKSLQELLLCVEDDIELMGLSHIIYLMEQDGQTVDYDYLPSELYTEAVTLKELQDELLQRSMTKHRLSAETTATDSPRKKLAVFFPGIGYTCDKPLLYYTEKLTRQHGYTSLPVRYGNFPKHVKGDPEAMAEAFSSALAQTEEILQDTDWTQYDEILFVSKSIGTVVAAAFATAHALTVRHILFTPLCETFSRIIPGQIAFHGTNDPWADTDTIRTKARQTDTLLFVTPEANHSLETGNVATDLKTLETVLKQVSQYLSL